MGYIQPKTDFKDGDILYGIDLNASNEVIKAGVDDNFDRIQGLETNKQDILTAGEGIQIENNIISNTQTSAEWGNIQGAIGDQVDLIGLLEDKQDKLISGTNIKTINNQSILGSGNISVGGGSGGTSDYEELVNQPQVNGVTLIGNKSLSDLGINIPTKVSDLNNDSGFINNTVNNLVNYTNTSDLTNLLDDKVDKVTGKQLSTEDYTSSEKTKLAGIETGAQVNVEEVLVGDVIFATEDTKLVIEDTDLIGQYTEADYYSTDEIKTNKITKDGKSVYRKVILGNTGSTANSWVTIGTISNIDKITDIRGTLGGYLPIPQFITASYLVALQKAGNDIQVYTVGYTNTAVEVIIEYTKTGGNS